MFSIEKLEYKNYVDLLAEILHEKRSMYFTKLIESDDQNIAMLGTIENYRSGKHRIICDILNPKSESYKLVEHVENFSINIIQKYNFEEYWLIFPKKLTSRERDRYKAKIIDSKKRLVKILDLDYLEELFEEFPDLIDKFRDQINTWHEAYSYIAKLLANLYEINSRQPARAIFDKLEETEYFLHNSGRLFQDDTKPNEKGLDPIQIFATFNYSRINSDERCKNINLLLRGIGADKRINTTIDYEGCPTPIIAQIIYKRNINVQNKIWDTFAAIMDSNTVDGLTEEHFKSIDEWYGIGIPAFTIFLFWIKSEIYLPLDDNTLTWIVGLKIVESKPFSYSEYSNLCKTLRSDTIGELAKDVDLLRLIVKESYKIQNENNEGQSINIKLIQLLNFLKTEIKIDVNEAVEEFEESKKHNFKLIGIKPHFNENGKPQRHIKNLKEDETYLFYNSYEIKDDDTIIYNSKSPESLYNIGDKKISISAIVGKNGSGKSSITELLYLIINKIAFIKGFETDKNLIDEPIYATLYFKSDRFYKLTIGVNIQIWEYELIVGEDKFILGNQIVASNEDLIKFDLSKLFYSIIINYSLYGLNSEHIGSWIESLFHKNDGYQTPIVLNPKREKGKIDVNEEEYLAKSRLLSNILEPDRDEITIYNKVPELLSGKTPLKLVLDFDEDKHIAKRIKHFKKKTILSDEEMLQIENAIKYFHLETIAAEYYIKEIKEYIYYKLISIKDYPQFDKYKNIYILNKFNENQIQEYIDDILTNPSHATFKLKQALNYLKYGIYKKGADNDILTCIKEIGKTKVEIFEHNSSIHTKSKMTETIELIPPSFFKFNILFDNTSSNANNSFNELSSGEKQKVLSINTILYHLINLNSIKPYKDLLKYNFINIVFDEVELYFHPEMQRTYIQDLLSEIEKLNFENLMNLNIIFVTHSPFILSDLPKTNVMMLESDESGKAVSKFPANNTFGANIHELLSESFFLSASIGEFSRQKINEIIGFYSDFRNSDKKDLEKFKRQFNEKRENYKTIVDNIGEEFIKGILQNNMEYLEENLIANK